MFLVCLSKAQTNIRRTYCTLLPLVVAVISVPWSRILLLDVGKVSEVVEDVVLSISITLRPCVVAEKKVFSLSWICLQNLPPPVLPVVILIIEGASFKNLKIARSENGIVNDGTLLEARWLGKANLVPKKLTFTRIS